MTIQDKMNRYDELSKKITDKNGARDALTTFEWDELGDLSIDPEVTKEINRRLNNMEACHG